MHIIVASRNPVKIAAVREGFAQMFPQSELQTEGISVPSEVADQPFSEAETFRGAENRASNAQKLKPEADFWVGVEGGIEDREIGMLAFAWTVVRSAQKEGKARTATFVLPPL
jgi:inosine/xanthosine triphosphatase